MTCLSMMSAAVSVVLTIASVRGLQDACTAGYAWREAFAGDHVCVPLATRSRTAADNRLAAARREAEGGAGGPDACRQGYVWREAGPVDHVCVRPETRAQVAADNGAAKSRLARNPRGKFSSGGAEPRQMCARYKPRDFGGPPPALNNGDIVITINDPQPNTGAVGDIHRLFYDSSWNDKVSTFKVEGGCTITLLGSVK